MNKLSEAKKILDEEINVRHMPTPVYRLYRNALCLLSEHQQEYEKLKGELELADKALEIACALIQNRIGIYATHALSNCTWKENFLLQARHKLNGKSSFDVMIKQALEFEREGE